MSSGPTNRLIKETSPYLLQHARNPVDWYPWGQEALLKARELDRPILLSIGYSSCHWCHVMERESFEDREVAGMMNDQFINIKVYREERPDVDSIYMNYVQMTGGHGGWPLTVFLTPDLTPFYGGTYFPPEDAYGRPGFKTVLKNVASFYRDKRTELEKKRDDIRHGLSRAGRLDFGAGEINREILSDCSRSLLRSFDHRFGGFGGAPKFPQSMTLGFLLREAQRTKSLQLMGAVKLSLDRMAQGGMYDQLGGGFHRYSVDERWLVPHFEKMLYDNALLAKTYAEAFQATGDRFYKKVVQETLEYLRRDLGHPEGGFFSAEDADSAGIEGKFYVWSQEEIESILGKETAEVFNDYFGVSRLGNWEGTNILYRRRSVSSIAEETGRSPSEVKALLDRSRKSLFEEREKRIRPGLDDKILASWNGLALSAFAVAGFVLGDADLVRTAQRNAEFIEREMIVEGRLLRTWKDGQARLNAYLDDYAHVAEGMIQLFQVTGEDRWIRRAEELTKRQIADFWDHESGDFYFTSSDHEKLLVRPREYLDNALPSGNSTSSLNLLMLAKLTGKREYRARAERLLEKIAPAVRRMPSAMANWLTALDFSLGPVKELVLVGPEDQQDQFLDVLREHFLPARLLVRVTGGTSGDFLSKSPLLEGRVFEPERVTAYVCEDYTCQEPTDHPEKFRELLQ